MANENALKISRQKNSPARFVLSFKDAFAGRSTMMAEVTDNPAYKQGLPEYNEVLRVPFFDKRDPRSGEKALNAIKEHVAKHEGNISVFGFEPMLGEGGYQAAPGEVAFVIPTMKNLMKEGNYSKFKLREERVMGKLFTKTTIGLILKSSITQSQSF
jgi:acetylornithine/N-succinyldiaminopimelate aminotransferase